MSQTRMRELARHQQHGTYYTRLFIGGFVTRQIHPDGLVYLKRQGFVVGSILSDSAMHTLERNDWLYTWEEVPHWGEANWAPEWHEIGRPQPKGRYWSKPIDTPQATVDELKEARRLVRETEREVREAERSVTQGQKKLEQSHQRANRVAEELNRRAEAIRSGSFEFPVSLAKTPPIPGPSASKPQPHPVQARKSTPRPAKAPTSSSRGAIAKKAQTSSTPKSSITPTQGTPATVSIPPSRQPAMIERAAPDILSTAGDRKPDVTIPQIRPSSVAATADPTVTPLSAVLTTDQYETSSTIRTLSEAEGRPPLWASSWPVPESTMPKQWAATHPTTPSHINLDSTDLVPTPVVGSVPLDEKSSLRLRINGIGDFGRLALILLVATILLIGIIALWD